MRKPYQILFEKSREGRMASDLPYLDTPSYDDAIPPKLLGGELPLPELSEVDVVRHFTGLARRNHGVDDGFYPLGSCTMKYNPKIGEEVANTFAALHPLSDEADAQGALQVMHSLDVWLSEITGMDKVTLQPAAGAHGELTGLMIIRAYHAWRGEKRDKILVPDTAHGTNPASVTMAGFTAVNVPSNAAGGVDIGALRKLLGSDTAGLMLTNPSTLGLFEKDILKISRLVHEAGGLLYYDGANFNAIMGVTRPGDMGFDVVHLNLHKTFATPHGGGGPGSGPVGVKAPLIPFLPNPIVTFDGERYSLEHDRPLSIGKVRSFYGNFAVYMRAYAYILSLGADGLLDASLHAVLNANYLSAKLKKAYKLPYNRRCMHEFVISGKLPNGVSAMDVAKALIDRGFHPPTVYFPLIVEEAMMIEPTETESKETLDLFVEAMLDIARLAKDDPDALKRAPETTPVGRPDQTLAARKPRVIWEAECVKG